MPEKDTHYGDEDPEFIEPDEEELFETVRQIGWKPEALKDKAFAERYKAWLSKQG